MPLRVAQPAMLGAMAFTITFSDGSSTEYVDDEKYKIEGNGILKLTVGNDVFLYSPHTWSRVKTVRTAPQVW